MEKETVNIDLYDLRRIVIGFTLMSRIAINYASKYEGEKQRTLLAKEFFKCQRSLRNIRNILRS